MSIHHATQTDLPYVIDLSKKLATEVGFIPRQAVSNYLDRGRITMARENGDRAGFFLVGRLGLPQVRIFQACVQYDARGLNHGIFLLSDLITKAALAGTEFLSLHCRDGLESNGFWSACGFQSGGLILGGKARRKIVHQWELTIADALAIPTLPYARHYLAALGARAAAGIGTQEGRALTTTPHGHTRLDIQESNVIAREQAHRTLTTFAPASPIHA
jgi:hypothetical protein